MRTIASVLFMCFMVHASAQRTCATHEYLTTLRSNSATAARLDAALAFAKQQSRNFISGISGSASGSNSEAVIRIPVVVHLLYNKASQNISDAQIMSGLAALNRDFRRQNKDTVNTPARFKAVAADVKIEFYLATADPRGVATTGIVRKQTSVMYFNMDDKIKFSAQGGDDAWDTKSYLNIWLGDMRRLLGYGTMPGCDTAVDGLVINISAFGTINTSSPYNMGRTAVHEIGHWLGLYHIWGDEACGSDDVDDTPQQGGYTSGCPSGLRTSCGNSADGDMYMNYMDFTNDACMNLFTNGQKQHMRAQFAPGGSRYSLLQSTGLDTPWVEAAPLGEKDSLATTAPLVQVFPNPATNKVVLKSSAAAFTGGTVYITTITGKQVAQVKITAPTQTISLTQLQPGIYMLHGVLNNRRLQQKLIKL